MAQLKDLMVYGDAKFLANAMLDHDPTLNLEAATKHYVDQAVTGTITGSGTSGYLVKWNGSSSITNGPQLGSGTTTYLRNDGTWATPANTTYTLGTGTTTVTLTPSSGSQQSITVPYATSAGKATNDASGRAIETTYGHALSVNGNTVGLEDGNGDAISGSFVTVPYATSAGSATTAGTANSVAWANVSGHAAGVKADIGIATSGSTFLRKDGTWATPTDTNTTYAISGALSSHKFTTTLTATNPSGTSTAALELAAGSNISLTDDTTNKKITIAATNTTYTLGTGTTTITLTPSSGDQQSITAPYATSAGKATNDASGRAIETTYAHALTTSGNTIGLEDGNGDAISGSFITAPYATVSGKISNITSTDTASSSATWRKVWMSYADGVTGRPAVTDALVFQTSTNTLKTTILEGKYVYVNSGAANSTTPVLIAKNKPATGGTAFVAEFDNNTESSTSTTWANCLVALAPNLAANTNATYANFCALAFGKANSNANVGTLNFHYSGSSSTANWVSIGFHSHNHILNVAATERVGIKNTAPISELDVTGGISWSSKATSQYNATDDCVEFIFV